MSLMLECVCSGGSMVCKLVSLTFVLDSVTITQVGSPPISAAVSLMLLASPFDSAAPSISLGSVGEYDLAVDDWAPRWPTITVQHTCTATGLQVPSPDYSAYQLYRARYHIEQKYSCKDAVTGETREWVVSSYTTKPDADNKCELDIIHFLCYAGRGVNSLFYKSSPLATCSGCSVGDGGFLPAIDNSLHIDAVNGSNICLCATGGTGGYTYFIEQGQLASGLTLNPDTGCIEGTADGVTSGTPVVTFGVSDDGGSSAVVGTVITVGGTCKVTFPHVKRITGGAFQTTMAGQSIIIAGVPHTILSVQDSDYLTIS